MCICLLPLTTQKQTHTKAHLQNNFYSLKKGFDGICYICMCEVYGWMDGWTMNLKKGLRIAFKYFLIMFFFHSYFF